MTLQPSINEPTHSEGMMLSRDDVERLLHDDSPDSRNSVLTKVALQYNEKTLSAREQEIAEHIFRLLMRDLSTRVRETLADRMKSNDEIPRDIVLHLANDVESVSTPVLESSNVLSDADLVSIVEKSHDMGKLIAITKREHVSSRVSGALVETNYAQVVSSLLGNEKAEISTKHLNHIVTEFAEDASIMDTLAAHPDLPISVVERLITQASDAVTAELREKYHLSDADVQANANKLREEFMLRLLDGELGQAEIEELVQQMARDNGLNPSILMTALCRGQLLFFTVALAAIAGIPLDNAQKLISDKGELGFNGLYRKSGLPDSMMDAVRLIVRAVQQLEGGEAVAGSMLYANRLVERVLYDAGEQSIEYLPYFIALIRQNSVRK